MNCLIPYNPHLFPVFLLTSLFYVFGINTVFASYGCFKVNIANSQDQPGLRPIQQIPTPIKLLISPLPEMINQICKKYSLENPQDKKTNDDTCDIFQK